MTVLNEITVVIGKDKVKATSKGGAAAGGDIHLDQLRLATIKVFEELLLDDTIQNRRHMEVLGQHLYAAIFDTAVDKLLNDKLNDVKQDRLRLQLQFEPDADQEIVSLPWEFLYSASRQDFLATDVNLVLSRYLELGKDREVFGQSERPLRALVVISRPHDEGVILAKDVVNKITALNVEGEEPVVKLQVVDQPTLDNIEAALKTHQPHIFHFIGHGKYDPVKRAGYLLLVNPETSNADRCDDSTLIDRFKNAQCYPRLVFLHMCEGGITEREATTLQAFSGFAPKLIHAKIPSVVAMQYPIKNEHARDFSLAFYSTLADGGSVDEAVQEGRRKLDLHRRSRLFGTPMLYMHSAGGLVLPRPRAATEKSTSSAGDGAQPKPVTQQPAGAAASASQAKLDQLINSGIEAGRAIPDAGSKIKLTQRLFKMKKDLTDKSSTDIFNTFFQAWEQEPDPLVKQVWETIMQAI